MKNRSSLEVHCPQCKSILRVDPSNGHVLEYGSSKAAQNVDLTEAAQNLKKEAKRRETDFQKSLEAEKNKGDLLQEKFKEALKRAQDDPDSGPPLREIDLD